MIILAVDDERIMLKELTTELGQGTGAGGQEN